MGEFSKIPAASSFPKISGVGLGLRHKHFREFIEEQPEVVWLEVHSENFFKLASPAAQCLEKIRENYPISLHGVGLSLGSAGGIDDKHLHQLKNAVEHFRPSLVSEHISWAMAGKIHSSDLLPLPYNNESLKVICDNIKYVQDFLGRQILAENPSSYLTFSSDEIPEWEFVSKVAENSGCGLLLDINNIYVSSENHGFDPVQYINSIPPELVKEMHLAGYSENEIEGKKILIDTHGNRVFSEVWKLFELAASRFTTTPTLIEWDTDIPALSVLLEEMKKAEAITNKINRKAA